MITVWPKVVWSILAAMFVSALMLPGTPSWIASVFCLFWFGVWEGVGIASKAKGDTLSESVWAMLDVEDHKPTNRALFPLVMGSFSAAAVLFVGVVQGAEHVSMSAVPRVVAACAVAAGTLGFLLRHFRRGDSK